MVRFFGFRTVKLQSFNFGALPGLRVFSNLLFGFQFFLTIMAVFRIFLPNAFYGSVLVLPRKFHPAVALKLYFKGPLT